MSVLHNKRILVGIGGGIAAYKSIELVRRLREAGSDVRVVMTQAATAFITPLTLQAVSQHPVHTELFDSATSHGMDHIELARWAEVILIAPATANRMAKLVIGLADDLLSTLCLATTAPVVLAPAMNQQMWQASATQANYVSLRARGVHFLGPDVGIQACGETGPGRMQAPEQLLSALEQFFSERAVLKNKHVLITAGPTREAIDPVRFLTNKSSGKMGYALAAAAAQAGAQVTLISGPVSLTCPHNVTCISVTTAQEMYTSVLSHIHKQDIFIATAAVADYCPHYVPQKIKKIQDTLTLTLTRTPDILASVAALPAPPFTVGFAAETENLIPAAAAKRAQKQVDIMIANAVDTDHSGFEVDHNAVTVLSRAGEQTFPVMLKTQLAKLLIQLIAEQYHHERPTTSVYSS